MFLKKNRHYNKKPQVCVCTGKTKITEGRAVLDTKWLCHVPQGDAALWGWNMRARSGTSRSLCKSFSCFGLMKCPQFWPMLTLR